MFNFKDQSTMKEVITKEQAIANLKEVANYLDVKIASAKKAEEWTEIHDVVNLLNNVYDDNSMFRPD